MNKYGLVPEVEQEIIQYCYDTVALLKDDFFQRTQIRKNTFLECLYDSSCIRYKALEDYKLTQDELQQCFREVKVSAMIMENFLKGDNIIRGVHVNDVLVFDLKLKKIKKTKKTDNEVTD